MEGGDVVIVTKGHLMVESTSLKEKLIRELKERYGNLAIVSPAEEPFAVFRAMHPDVGDASIFDEDSSIVVQIGEITHGHFDGDYRTTDLEERKKEIVSEVLDFLEDLFVDKYVLQKSSGGGGWTQRDFFEQNFERSPNVVHYVWSGPY